MWTNRINYMLLTALVVVGMLFYNHYVFVLFIIGMIVMPIITFIFGYNAKKKMKIYVKCNNPSIGKNILVGVDFVVKNSSLVPVENFTLKVNIYNGFYNNNMNYELIIPSVPLGERSVGLMVKNLYCGRMVVEVQNAVMYDLLGLFKYKLTPDVVEEIMVMPYEQTELENIPVSTKGNADDEELQQVKGDDVSQISEIRNYIPGDKLQNIHWKLTAKEQELQVKEYSMPYSDEVTLLVETYIDIDSPNNFDEKIEKMFAISKFFISQGRKFRIAWFDENIEDFEEREIGNSDELFSSIIDFYYLEPVKIMVNRQICL